MAGARSAKGITARPTSQAAPSQNILHALEDIFARAASGYLQDSQLAKDMFEMQEQWVAETVALLREVSDQPSQIEPILQAQLKKLHGYIYVNSTPTLP